MAAVPPALPSARQERKYIAAIDFGTTYSGYAFSSRVDFLKDPLSNIVTNEWKSSGLVSLKTPSCILFHPNQKCHSFGTKAEDKYARLAANDDGDYKRWFFFKEFKMFLYENKGVLKTSTLKDDKGLKMSAMTVFSESIRYLKDHLLQLAKRKKSAMKPDDIHWVLTVPAIWDDPAKIFMKEAAVQSGIKAENLSLALEPEAASLFCKYLPVDRIKDSHGETVLKHFGTGRRYLVLDAGGGTVDITVHETQDDETMKELFKASGGPWGGTRIDDAFHDFLGQVVGSDAVESFRSNSKEDHLKMQRDFEIKKKTFGPDAHPSQTTYFHLPLSLIEMYRTNTGIALKGHKTVSGPSQSTVTIDGDKLKVQQQHMTDLFKVTCKEIVNHLKDIFSAVGNTNTIVMVGGFSESKILQDAIKNNFVDKKIIIPEDAGLAVLKGAVIFGHYPDMIITRVSRWTYGLKTNRDFKPGTHPENRKKQIDGKAKCTGCFSKHIEINDEVRVGSYVEAKQYHPSSAKSKTMTLKLYASKTPNPEYVDKCRNIGQLEIDFSSIRKYEDRIVTVNMIYGHTDIQVEARVGSTNELVEAKLKLPDK